MQFVEANGAKIPQLGLGTWELRGALCTRLVEQALRLGYRHLDSAQVYDNEREVGEGLRAAGIARSEVFITTKVWWTRFAAGDLERSAEESVRRLKVDAVDLLLLHWPNSSVPLEETIGALNAAKERGLTQHIGVSNFTVALLDQAVKLSRAKLVTDQIECHSYLDQSKVIAACKRHGLAVTAYSPIAKGAATRDKTLARIGHTHKKSAAQVCLRYLVQQGIVVIPRTSRLERLSENAEIFDFELSAGEMAAIRALASPKGRTISPSWSPAWD
ncbi:MAG TPA: aldo/keto reductase [Xanthobacteraceae bacterium]|nr:aldo/keto reductase [Xanthobacteraceae bacterium]